MRVIEIRQTGGPEVLEQVDRTLPEPGPGQVRVRHEAIGLNLIDTYHRKGVYPVKLPFTLGSEAAGVVDAIGPEVEGWRVGERVAYLGQGAYAEFGIAPADRLIRLPEGISAELAAASLLKGMTAEFLAERIMPLRGGEAALVYAAAGGVGSILTQWLAAKSVRVLGVVGTEEKAAIARGQGAAEVILSGEAVTERVRALTGGEGARIAYDSVGKDTFEATLKSLARRGMFVSYGNASGPVPPFEPLLLSRHGSLLFTRPTLFDYVATQQELAASSRALFERLLSGAVRIEIGQRFKLADVADAHRAIEARKTTGSTVLVP